MLESSSGALETRTDNSAVEPHQTDEYFQSNNEVKNSVSTAHYGGQSKISRDENFEMSEKTSISREVDLGSIRMAVEQSDGELTSDLWLERNTNCFVGALAESREVHFVTGSSYEGTWDALGMAGVGRYVLPNGTIYEGEIRDGMFHGQGSFYWTGNRRLDVVHFRGELKEYKYQFQDGLNYDDTNGEYCKFPDRRFYESIKKGLKPGGRTLKTARPTAKVLPAGCYDTGDGIFYPKTQHITSYDDSKEVLRIPSAEEYAWILEKCRKSWSEPTGYRPELNENWSENPPNLPYNLPMSHDSPDHWWKRLTTFVKDPNFLAGRNEKDVSSSGRNHETLSIPKVCMCGETVLIGEPCRCIRCSSSWRQEEYGESRRTLSEEMYENQYEIFESSSEMQFYFASNVYAEFLENLNRDESLIEFQNNTNLRKSIQTSRKVEPEYQAMDESLTNKYAGESRTNEELKHFRSDSKNETFDEKRGNQKIEHPKDEVEKLMLLNTDGKSFTRIDKKSMESVSKIISKQDIEENRRRNDDSSKKKEKINEHSGKSSGEKFFNDKKFDSSTDLIPREKVSRETVPEVNKDRSFEMKLLPENSLQKHRDQMTTEIESEHEFSVNRETKNFSKILEQMTDGRDHKSEDRIDLESSTIHQELSEKNELNDREPNNATELVVDNAEYESKDGEHSLGEEKKKHFPSNTLEIVKPDDESRSHLIENRKSTIETNEKIKTRESSSAKTNADEKLIESAFDDKPPLNSRDTSTKQIIPVSLANEDSKYSSNEMPAVELQSNTSTHYEEQSSASKVGISELEDLEKPQPIERSELVSTDDNELRSDSEKHLKTYISSGSEMNEEVSEVLKIISVEKSSTMLSSRNVEKSSLAGLSSRWDKTKSSISSREDSTSLDKVHPSLATLKSKKQELSKEKRLVEIYNKHYNTKKLTNESVKSNVWRLSSANQNYGPETKIKNLLFNPAFTPPRSENVVYVRKPCDYRACTTSIREVRATASRTGKEYPPNIPTKTLSSHSNVHEKK